MEIRGSEMALVSADQLDSGEANLLFWCCVKIVLRLPFLQQLKERHIDCSSLLLRGRKCLGPIRTTYDNKEGRSVVRITEMSTNSFIEQC